MIHSASIFLTPCNYRPFFLLLKGVVLVHYIADTCSLSLLSSLHFERNSMGVR